MLILRTHSLDPYQNLATEDHLLDRVPQYGRILFLWQSDHTVVVGKNQNPWRECRLDRIREDRGLVARRVTGGGAVYHDLGNLNYAYFLPREEYAEDQQFEMVHSALETLGAKTERMGRSSIAVNGKKVSGNAFCFRRNSALHHGTLLVSSNLERLQRYLEPVDMPVETRAVRSVPAEVGNLADAVPGLDIDAVAEALATSFALALGEEPLVQSASYIETPELHALRHKHVSWEWCYGATPPFTITLENSFEWGGVAFRMEVKKGRIVHADVKSDAMDGAEIGHLEGQLLDCPFKETAIARRVRKGIGKDGHAFLEDLADWFSRQALS